MGDFINPSPLLIEVGVVQIHALSQMMNEMLNDKVAVHVVAMASFQTFGVKKLSRILIWSQATWNL